jgi:hypothetical protein
MNNVIPAFGDFIFSIDEKTKQKNLDEINRQAQCRLPHPQFRQATRCNAFGSGGFV